MFTLDREKTGIKGGMGPVIMGALGNPSHLTITEEKRWMKKSTV